MLLIKIFSTVSLLWELLVLGDLGTTALCCVYVSSKPALECNTGVSHEWACGTIDEYAINNTQQEMLIDKDNVTMFFLPGVHNLTRNLTVDGKLNFTMMASNQANKTIILLSKGSITIQNSVKVNLSKLSIDGLSKHSISIKGVLDLTIQHVVITGSALLLQCLHCNTVTILDIHCIGSALVIGWPDEYFSNSKNDIAYEKVRIRDTVFHLSPVGNGLSCCNVHSSVIRNISMSDLPANSTIKPPRRGLITFCNHYPWGLTNLEVCDLLTTHIDILKIYSSTFKRTNSTGLCVNALFNAYVSIFNSTIINHTKGGAIFTLTGKGISVLILNNTISNNSNNLISSTMSSALSVYSSDEENSKSEKIPSLVIYRTNFINNRHLVGKHITTVSILSPDFVTASIHESNFIDNYGSAITAYTTNVDNILVIFSGPILFRNNTSHRGGAIHLFKSRIGFKKGVNITFQDNFAKDVGGAIYVHSSERYSPYYELEVGNHEKCFYKLMDCVNPEQASLSVSFKNNSAKNGGEHIFGASVLSECTVCSQKVDSTVVQHIFDFTQPRILTFSPLSSHPSRVCLCDHDSEIYTPRYFCTNVSQIFLSRSVHPGEEFNLEAVIVGAEFGAGTGSVYAQFLSQSSSELYPPYQYSQRVDNFKKCTHLSYTVYSSNSQEVLVLTSSDETVFKYGDQTQIEKESYYIEKNFLMTVAPSVLLTTPVYINLTLLLCPEGFHLTGSPPRCECVPALTTNDIFCNLTNGTGYVYRNGTVWVDSFKDGIIIQKRCPFDFCLSDLTGVDLRDPDTQCAMNRAGTLCGECKKGFSLGLGTNMCISCKENKNLALIVFFILAGALLVVFIKVLNTTVSQGTINGLVFYANVVWAYQDVFFPKHTSNTWYSLMKTFIGWLNLDFGIKTCFVQGLTGYVKTWMQFVFPLYIWSIAGVMIILAHYSNKITKLFGNNCVQVLATLFLLSYAKLFRTIIIVMVPAVLEIYPQNSDERSDISVVWAFDGNLSYGGNPHGFLLVVALLILIVLWLPFTAILLLYKILMKGSSHKCFKWITRIVPLIETYFGPLKLTHYYWVGLLLLVRGVLLIILTITYTTTPTASLLSLVITLTLLLVFLAYTGRVYQNRFLSLLEYSFLLNLQVLGVSILFIDLELSDVSKEVAVSFSTTIAFIQFLGIICYHVYQLVRNKRSKCHNVQQRDRDTTENVDVDRYQLMEDESVNDFVKRDLIGLQYLEDYAQNSDSRK